MEIRHVTVTFVTGSSDCCVDSVTPSVVRYRGERVQDGGPPPGDSDVTDGESRKFQLTRWNSAAAAPSQAVSKLAGPFCPASRQIEHPFLPPTLPRGKSLSMHRVGGKWCVIEMKLCVGGVRLSDHKGKEEEQPPPCV